MLCFIHVYILLIKTKHISNAGKLREKKNTDFYNRKIRWLSYTTFKSIVANNLISNSGINVDGIEQTVYIYGMPKAVLKGKITRVPPNQSPIPCISIPQPIFQYHQKY